jgi:RND family efflux transporter MFP subunit
MQIIDPTYLLAQVAVPEKYQRLVEVNDLAAVQVPGISQPVPGLVALVNEKIDPETRTFRVRVGVENLRRGLESGSSAWVFKSGSYARVTLSLESAADALVVPSEAVTFEEGKPAVFVFQGDHVQKRPVRLGIFDRRRYEVVDGLSEGEQVVAGKTALLADGMPVRLKAAGPSPGETARSRAPTGGDAAGSGDASLSLATDPVGAQP